MVHVVPPPGWTPSPKPPVEPHSPPPLDRVAASHAALSLEPTEQSLARSVFSSLWFIGGVASLITLAVVSGLCWLMLRSEPKSASVDSERPANAVAEETSEQPPVAVVESKETSPPTATVADKTADAPIPSGPQSEGVPDVKPAPTTPSPTVPPGAPPPVAKEPAKDAAKESKEVEHDKPEVPQVEFKKTSPVQVDVAARMADPLRGIELTDIPLARALDVLAAMSTLPITLDPDAMRQLGVTPRDRITIKLDSTTVEQALNAVATQRRLAVAIDNGQVIITTPAEFRETLKTVRYTVSDLTGDDKAALAEFAGFVQMLVAPESWQAAGGRGTIAPNQGVLVVSQTGDVHQQVLVFCEKLRKARRKPLRSRDAPERFMLTARTSQARKLLDQPVTANFRSPAALARILTFLAERTGSDILIDRAALASAETSDRVETSLTVQNQPLGVALANLLHPLGLTYRVIAPNAIQATTTEAADDQMELEFYPLGQKMSDAEVAKLIERLKAAVSPTTWTDGGGQGEVYFDAPSQTLIVLQSQPTQAALERLLTKTPQ